MRQGLLKFHFDSSPTDDGLMITSPDVDNLCVVFSGKEDVQVILDVVSAALPFNLLVECGLSSGRHVMVMDDPGVNIIEGGHFSCVMVPASK